MLLLFRRSADSALKYSDVTLELSLLNKTNLFLYLPSSILRNLLPVSAWKLPELELLTGLHGEVGLDLA